MPLELCNAPLTLNWTMNEIVRDFLHKFVTVYMDDVYVYHHVLDEHLEHLLLVLRHFKEEGFKLRLIRNASSVFWKWSI
jgi:hypothetical protein